MEEVDKEDVGILQTTQTSLEKALINVVDCLTREDLRACLEDLDHEGNIPAEGTNYEELKSRNPSEKTKLVVPYAPPPTQPPPQVAHHQWASASALSSISQR